MKRTYIQIPIAGLATLLLAACSSTPERIEELEAARTLVPTVEASPRAGVAAAKIAEARKALDRANQLAEKGKDVDEIRHEAKVATLNAQIANEAILTAQAKDDIDKGNAERQQVILEARQRETERLQQEMQALQAKQTERGMVLTLGDVLFDTGKSTLKAGAYSTIDRLAEVLKESSNRKVMIEGHTDSTGSDETNQLLSQQRALAVQAALLERGVSAGQVAAVGKGESMPVASNDDAAGRQRNRRVDLIVSQDTSRVASD
jgi:outer membrane protein OmpA-like peptidoglycan-associated protein